MAWRLHLRKPHPLGAEFRGLHDGFDEGHAVDAVFDGGEVEVLGLFLAGDFGFDRAEGFEVNIGKGLQITFGMTGRDAGERGEIGGQVVVAATPGLARLVGVFDDEFIGEFLLPFDPGLGAVNADVEHVFIADADLRGMENAFGAAFVAHEHVAVVVEFAAFDEGGEIGAEGVDLESGDVAGEIFGMGADVAHTTGGAAAFRIGAPGGLFVIGCFDEAGKPALRVFDDDFADVAELAFLHELAGLFHHHVAGVVVREHEHFFRLFDDGPELLGLGEIEGGGLIEDDVEAGFEKQLRRREVLVVGRDDDDEIEPLISGHLRLGFRHFSIGAVGAIRRNVEIFGGGLGALGVRGKGSGDEFRLPIHVGGDAMDGTDKGAASAADHSKT